MGKLTYLQLTNRVLKRISQPVITDVSTATGQALIITELINESLLELFTETNWYSMFKTRKFSTVTYNASTIAFNDAGPDTITDSANGFGSFEDGMQILVAGSASNDGTWNVSTSAVGTLTLQSADALTTEAAGESVSITATTYPVATDWGRTLTLVDITNNCVLMEEFIRAFDEDDPDSDYTGTPDYFGIEGSFYRLYPMPAGAYKMRDSYWKLPTTLTANADLYDLPIECENVIIQYTYMKILQYLNKFELADRAALELKYHMKRALSMNQKMIDKMYRLKGGRDYVNGIHPPRFPLTYGARYY